MQVSIFCTLLRYVVDLSYKLFLDLYAAVGKILTHRVVWFVFGTLFITSDGFALIFYYRTDQSERSDIAPLKSATLFNPKVPRPGYFWQALENSVIICSRAHLSKIAKSPTVARAHCVCHNVLPENSVENYVNACFGHHNVAR